MQNFKFNSYLSESNYVMLDPTSIMTSTYASRDKKESFVDLMKSV